MSGHRPGIGAIPAIEPALAHVLASMKERLELIDGSRKTKIAPLQSTATLAQVITTLNALLSLLQG